MLEPSALTQAFAFFNKGLVKIKPNVTSKLKELSFIV